VHAQFLHGHSSLTSSPDLKDGDFFNKRATFRPDTTERNGAMPEHSRDPDALHDDAPIARLEIVARRNGALSVGGDIGDLSYALALLGNAADALRNHHARRALIVPARDVSLPQKVIV
jgi:hypothetical protein